MSKRSMHLWCCTSSAVDCPPHIAYCNVLPTGRPRGPLLGAGLIPIPPALKGTYGMETLHLSPSVVNLIEAETSGFPHSSPSVVNLRECIANCNVLPTGRSRGALLGAGLIPIPRGMRLAALHGIETLHLSPLEKQLGSYVL